VNRGVPYEVAFGLAAAERMAYVVIFGTLDGYSYDWQKHRWRDD
jgi:hypothetical protein